MTNAQYSGLVAYASAVLRSKRTDLTLCPHDLVANAYLLVRQNDPTLLRQKILDQAYSEARLATMFLPYYDVPLKNKRIEETTRICKNCGSEKGLDSFPMRKSHGGAVRYFNTFCRTCQNRKTTLRKRSTEYKERLMSDPVRYAHYLETLAQKHKRKHARIKADPERWNHKLSQGRVTARERYARMKEDPEKWAAHKEKERLKRKAIYARLIQDPEWAAKQKASNRAAWERRKARLKTEPVEHQKKLDQLRNWRAKKAQSC
ncbi:hypothetical protein [Spirosoma fluminis]